MRHSYKDPIMQTLISYGIILLDGKGRVLLVRRRNSFALTDLITGPYPSHERLVYLMTHMTKAEQRMLGARPAFDDLWAQMRCRSNRMDYMRRKLVYETLLPALPKYIAEYPSTYHYAEWGFPKGRPMRGEAPIDTAMREMAEETGIGRECYTVMGTVPQYEERHVTRGILFKSKYFIAVLNQDGQEINLDFQCDEISKIAWVRVDNSKTFIRSYYLDKLAIMDDLPNLPTVPAHTQ
jgi:8-oxo-dGTP pyrophosphatase MutT (NUDIX family)